MSIGNTNKVGIIGWPVEHSLSPAMHNAAFAAAGLDYVYVPLPVPPSQLKEAVEGLKVLGFAGANVTIPYKVKIMTYLDEFDASARSVGAVNTIVIKEGKCIGYNTDAAGFIQSLGQKNIAIEGKQAVLLGAGGAARAVVCGLLDAGIARIIIGARSRQKAEVFIQDFQADCLEVCDWQDKSFQENLAQCDILINCTPLGMSSHIQDAPPVQWNHLKKTAAVCDLIYNPPVTKFLYTAQQAGHLTLNGEGMLIGQGAVAFRLWTGCLPDIAIMKCIFNKK